MKKLLTLFILIGIVTVGIFAGSPYYTAYQLNQAYKNNDGKTIADSIDYANLQYNVSTQLSTRLDDTLNKYPLIKSLGGKVTLLSEPFIKTAVNGALTSDNIQTAVESKTQVNDATKQLAVAWAVASDRVNIGELMATMLTQPQNVEQAIKQQIEAKVAKQELQAKKDASNKDINLSYCGLNCFNVTSQVKGYPVTISMERHGFIEWKITNIILP